MSLFVCATEVRGGKARVFGPEEISVEAVLASACLPTLFHPVEIDGETYWDGGYLSNPPLLPLVEGTDCDDILIVQVDPLRLAEAPTTAEDIRDRVQTLVGPFGTWPGIIPGLESSDLWTHWSKPHEACQG